MMDLPVSLNAKIVNRNKISNLCLDYKIIFRLIYNQKIDAKIVLSDI